MLGSLAKSRAGRLGRATAHWALEQYLAAHCFIEHPPPIDRIHALLARHNPLEEGPQGVYAECDRLLGPQRAGRPGASRVGDAAGARPRVAPCSCDRTGADVSTVIRVDRRAA